MTTHLNKKNNPTMVDISKKNNTKRLAVAQGTIQFSKNTFNKVSKEIISGLLRQLVIFLLKINFP